LKVLFKNKMESRAPEYLGLIGDTFNDTDVDTLIEHFRNPERRKEFFKKYKEIEMLYEIISPDAFLRPFIADYASLSAMYHVVRKAYTKTVYVDRDFQAKTNDLVRENVGTYGVTSVGELVEINAETVDLIKKKHAGDGTKVINLIKSIEKVAEDKSDDPFLVAMAVRARVIQEQYEGRQVTTQDALDDLLEAIRKNEARKKQQAEKGFDSRTFYVFETLREAGVEAAESVSTNVRAAFLNHPNWQSSEAELRELRNKITFAVFAEVDDLDQVTRIVDALFSNLER
jgi:type I restriction enzyme R subunit